MSDKVVMQGVERIVKQVSLFSENESPEVNVYLMNNKTKQGKYRLQVTIGLHDYLDKLDRKSYSLTLPDTVSTAKQAKKQVEFVRSLIQTQLDNRFKKFSEHSFIVEMEKSIKSKRGFIRDNTVDNYEYRFETVRKYFENKGYTVEEITPTIIKEFIKWCLVEGKTKSSGGLARRSVVDIHGLLYSFFKEQISDGVIQINPCEGTVIPKDSSSTNLEEDDIWLDVEDYHKLLEWLDREDTKSKYKKLIDILKVTITYGLRKEELLALKWDAVCLEESNKHIEIKRTRTIGKKIYDVEDVKSKASHRRYPITQEIEEILVRIKNKQVKNNINTEYVFSWDIEDGNRNVKTSEVGDPYRPDYIGKLWTKMIKEYNEVCDRDLSKLTFHRLRHSCASVLFDSDWSLEEVQEWLGHDNSEVTKRIYIHKTEKWKNEKLSSLEGIWNKHN